MDRYKIDQLKKGKEAAEKYFPQLSGGATLLFQKVEI